MFGHYEKPRNSEESGLVTQFSFLRLRSKHLHGNDIYFNLKPQSS